MKITVVIWFLLLFVVGSYGQAPKDSIKYDTSVIEQKQFDKDRLEAYKKDSDFNYLEGEVNRKESFLMRVFKWFGRLLLKFLEWIFGVESAAGIFLFIIRLIPYLIGLAALILLIRLFVKNKTSSIISSSKNKSVVRISEDIDLIRSENLELLIQKAIDEKQFRLAIRYSYLNILKALEEGRFIVWEQQKTNEDYFKELKLEILKKHFRKLTDVYDFIWYGYFEITEPEFATAIKDFRDFSSHLKTRKNV